MKLLILSLAVALLVEAAPTVLYGHTACTTKTQRKAWHTLTRDEKLAYIDAEKCLMAKSPKIGLEGARTLFDEFQKVHVLNTEHVHFVGAFLPFHRYLMHTHETILRTECNYTGTQPYWEETLDAGNFTHSIVLDPETGFGGNGSGSDNCIKDGPFKDYINSIGPYKQITDHCIERNINECQSAAAAQKNVDSCMAMKNFTAAWPCIEGAIHGAGHGGIGGEMLNVYSSPGDPVFYLHHTYLDKVWWQWQAKDLPFRLTEIGGTNAPSAFFGFPSGNESFPGPPGGGNGASCGGFPGFGTPPTDATTEADVDGTMLVQSEGDLGNVTTLGHVLTTFGLLPNITIADVMDIQGGYLCYEYV